MISGMPLLARIRAHGLLTPCRRNLTGMGLTGALVGGSAWAQLSRLTAINLNRNSLAGPIPNWQLPGSLLEMRLSYNQLNGR